MSKICTLDIVNGYVINQIRLEAGYKKQVELGEKFGMSHAAIGKMERGESSISLEFLTILAEMIGSRASRIVAVTEDIANYLLEHDVAFMSQTTYNALYELIKDSNNEEQENFIVPANIEDNISLELKKAVRNLVSKKPDMDVAPIQQEISSGMAAATLNVQTTGIALGAVVSTAAFINPLLGIGIGASLLATKFLKNKKAP